MRAKALVALAILAHSVCLARAGASAHLRRASTEPLSVTAAQTQPRSENPTLNEIVAPSRRPTQSPTPRGRSPDATLRGCLTWEASEAYINQLAREFPQWVTREEIGKSVEGRPISALCVGQCQAGAQDTRVPEALLNAMHHSRECVSMMALVKTLETIFSVVDDDFGKDDNDTNKDQEDYKDAWAYYILRSRRMWIIPVVNPDGFVYNEEQLAAYPGAIRHAMQRKNRAPPPSQKYCSLGKLGVDLNRNYATCFFEDDKDDPIRRGASLNPCDEDYQGPVPFSEPESQAIRDLVERSNFTTALNLHSFGKFLLLPWSCKSKGMSNEESEFYLRLGRDFAGQNHFHTAHSYKAVGYAVDGDAADWMFDAHGIYAMSPEVGPGDAWVDAKPGRDGFWPDADTIDALAQANIDMVLQAVLAAGSYLRLQRVQVTNNEQGALDITAVVENGGLWNSWGPVQVFLRPDHPTQATTTLFTQLLPIPAKFHNALAHFPVERQALEGTFATLTLGILDDRDCVLYKVSVDDADLARLASAATDTIALDSLTGPNAFGQRFARSHAACAVESGATEVLPPPTMDSNATSNSFFHSVAADLAMSAAFAICACFFVARSRRRAARMEYRSIQLPQVSSSVPGEYGSDNDDDDHDERDTAALAPL
ncbi:Carboxypeptidase A4 [Hondaea fermentalgiana]|uniref:Carboxypeptidase A4 n=1 Tax=Hondaea fermentalgiana TaxID=2315210 RepID=A0A2R5G8Y6_9STRA|nr:Carboxypeptidase A4 [Hondaea fermentalgiana]|eukprot:GBG27005.1 Carboxypeptidase A4 [Hondaea fermentalgiana]